MSELNKTLFLFLNAPEHPHAFLLAAAQFFANYAIWIVPIGLVVGWLRGDEKTRKLLLEAAASGFAGLLLNQLIGLVWQYPRPFMIGLGNTFIPHAADSSFPSDHLTLLWAVAFSFLMHQRPRSAGIVLAILGLPMAWARIYLGVHFPMDMAGAAIVAGLSAWLCLREVRWFMKYIFPLVNALYLRIFRPFIRRGWVRN